MNIVFCASEVFPFVKTGGLADVCGALPLALEKLGLNLTIVLPKHKSISAELSKVDDGVYQAGLGSSIRVLFIEHDAYFNRDELYGDQNGDYPDNFERFQFFCRQALSILKKMEMQADIIHCHDWQTALIPVYLKFMFNNDPFFRTQSRFFRFIIWRFRDFSLWKNFQQSGWNWGRYRRIVLSFMGKSIC